MQESPKFPNRIGMAWPRKRFAIDKLTQGRSMLDFARLGEDYFVGMIEAYLTIENPNSTREERIRAGENWRNGAMLTVIATLDPISRGKKKKRIPVFVSDVERRAREAIRNKTLEKGGTEKQAKYLQEKLTNMTKSFQIKNGVINKTDT